MNASGSRLGRHSARIWIIFLLGLPGLLSVQRALCKAPDPSLSQLPARPTMSADASSSSGSARSCIFTCSTHS